ncbi:unnamed protein product [Gongylonema pulchrum]|uniref:Amino acid transporter n=1 Tax=Gongylonema pulchrum TaxID=637853 RepID=A0A183DLG9_9BILA|nr:unnamed protein product [Gongylonema pulchrum]
MQARFLKEKSTNAVSVAIVWVNFYSLEKSASVFQIVATAAKLIAMALIIIGGAYCLIFKGMTDNFKNPMENSFFNMHSLVVALNAGFYSYFGWDILNYSIGEIRNPARYDEDYFFLLLKPVQGSKWSKTFIS